MNSVCLIGRTTTKPEVTTTNSGLSVIYFRLAVTKPFKDKQGNKRTDFIHCIAWRGTAEVIDKYVNKGDQMGVTGSIENTKYTNKDGIEVSSLQVTVNQIDFINSRKDTPVEDGAPEGYNAPEYSDDEALPF